MRPLRSTALALLALLVTLGASAAGGCDGERAAPPPKHAVANAAPDDADLARDSLALADLARAMREPTRTAAASGTSAGQFVARLADARRLHPHASWPAETIAIEGEACELLAEVEADPARRATLHRRASASYAAAAAMLSGRAAAELDVLAGDAAYDAADPYGAAAAYERALTIDSRVSGYAAYRLAYALYDQGRDDDARAALDRAADDCARRPDDPQAQTLSAEIARVRAQGFPPHVH